MKRNIAIAVLLFAFCRAGFAPMLIGLPAPQDAGEARRGVRDRPELKPFHAEYQEIIATRFFPLQLDDAAKIFGPKLETATNWWGDGVNWGNQNLGHDPDGLVQPLFGPGLLVVSGLHSTNAADNKNHTDLHAIGDLGYVAFYYQNDGTKVQTAAIYFRADDKFVPLKSTNDFSKRLEWDKARFGEVKKWLDEHLPKCIDLGVVEISKSRPTRIGLGAEDACIVTARDLHSDTFSSPAFWFSINFAKDTADQKEKQKSMQYRSIDHPGENLGFMMDGKFYRMTPKVVE